MKTRLIDALRPKSLDEVIGQDHAKAAVKNYIQQGCQRWLFHGPTGTGKTSLARIVAHELGAEAAEIHELNGAEFGIGDIVELVAQIRCMPMYGKHRVIILDEAQAITEAAKS